MDSYPQSSGPVPGSMRDNRYARTSEYQLIKVLRSVVRILEIATRAIISLLVDVVKGILGKS